MTGAPQFDWVPGQVRLARVRGEVVLHEASGHALLYANGAKSLLPEDDGDALVRDTVFDVASITKVFTTLVLAHAVERRVIDLDEPVQTYLPEFADKSEVHVRHLALHTSGLPWWLPLWRDWPDRDARLHAVLTCPLHAAAGTLYTYSDLNLITLQLLLERVLDASLDALVSRRITDPIGMRDTSFGPVDPARCAATEDEVDAGRGMVRGEVHDENAWSLGGVSGHAGIFSTAQDLGLLGQAVLDGDLGGPLVTDDLSSGRTGEQHSLVFEIDRPAWMGDLASSNTLGHTGFTGASIVIDRAREAVAVLLTNRVHPTRETPSIHPLRATFADEVARLA